MELESTSGYMPMLYLWAMVKSSNTNIPQVSLAGKSEKASLVGLVLYSSY